MKRVLLITVDQMRADVLGCMGHPIVKTPNLDALASDGTLFTRHYTPAVPCGPARASLLTGLYPTNHRMITNGTPLDGSFTNLALEMRAGGYDPTLFGYTDVAPDPRQIPEDDPRLKTYEGVLPGFTVGQLLVENNQPWLSDLKSKGYDVPGPGYAIYAPDPSSDEAGLSAQPARYKAEDSETAWLMNKVIDHLDGCASDPFFIHASFIKPHPPFIAPEPYNSMYRDADIPQPIQAIGSDDQRPTHQAVKYFQDSARLDSFVKGQAERPLSDLDGEDIRNIRATYYGLVSEVDHHIGRLMSHLKALGIYEDTLIILTGDHGEQMGDHGLFGKTNCFEKSYHIPLMIKMPGGKGAGQRVSSFTESVDIMPTLLQACELEIPHQCDGRSLVPFLAGEAPLDWRKHVCGLYDFRDVVGKGAERHFGLSSDQCSLMFIRDDSFKYVHFNGLSPILFDLSRDPDETCNQAENPMYLPKMLEYAQKLLTWRMRYEYGALDRMSTSPNGLVKDPDLN